MEKQKTSGSAVPTGLKPNLFTRCTLQAFAVRNSTTDLLKYLVTSAVLVPQNALSLASHQEYLMRWGVITGTPPCVFTSSLSAPPHQLLHLASFTCFGATSCDLMDGSRQSRKFGQNDHAPFYAHRHRKKIYHKQKKFSIHQETERTPHNHKRRQPYGERELRTDPPAAEVHR